MLYEAFKVIFDLELIHDDSPCIDLFDMDRLQARLENVMINVIDIT